MMREEYPRPDMRRENWINLNGEWEFAEDYSRSGRERGLQDPGVPDECFPLKINVPFCRESVLSGLGHVDFCDAVWYRRSFAAPAGWPAGRTFLRIGACDWKTTVWVNGRHCGTHTGGYVSFSVEITDALKEGDNAVVILAEDNLRSHRQAAGKQSDRYASHGCSYTRTTGIWQTVSVERVPCEYIRSFRFYPDINDGTLGVVASCAAADGALLTVSASYEGRPVGSASATVCGGTAVIKLPLSELHLWEAGEGRLYDAELTLGEDRIDSYFGMRSVAVKDGFLLLNGKRIFQRLVLDQGFYPDGIYTARDLSELEADVLRSKACGFNGARLHQKIFEPNFLYFCDKHGYIVWGEHANWVMNASEPGAWANFIPEWLECVERDFNHPAIVGWCPLNETQRDQDRTFVRSLAALTRSADSTRAYIDASGWNHVEGLSDILDNHDYDQDPASFRKRYEDQYSLGIPADPKRNSFPVTTKFVSEYGGIRWAPADASGWGYGNAPKTPGEFLERWKGLTEALLDNPGLGGLCYTQLTDVEQEVNGLYTYDRRAKFDPDYFKKILGRPAAIETAENK